MRKICEQFLVVTGCCLAICWTSPIAAKDLEYEFQATLNSGPLAGTQFSGSFSYDSSKSAGVGTEYIGLSTLDFSLFGIPFTKTDLRQGGQVILQDGTLSYFTAAFFPPPPVNSPVNDIAFGFGGPGIIGYVVTGGIFGDGVYVTAPVPEPSALAMLLAG